MSLLPANLIERVAELPAQWTVAVVNTAPKTPPSESELFFTGSIADEITFWHWLIAGVALLILEMFAPGVVFMWVGIAAMITGIVAWALPGLSLEWLLIIFATLSMASIISGRAYMKTRKDITDHPTLSDRGAKYVGRQFVLEEPITGGFGKIKVDDTTWKVSGDDLPAGAKIEIVAVEGTVFKVEARE